MIWRSFVGSFGQAPLGWKDEPRESQFHDQPAAGSHRTGRDHNVCGPVARSECLVLALIGRLGIRTNDCNASNVFSKAPLDEGATVAWRIDACVARGRYVAPQRPELR